MANEPENFLDPQDPELGTANNILEEENNEISNSTASENSGWQGMMQGDIRKSGRNPNANIPIKNLDVKNKTEIDFNSSKSSVPVSDGNIMVEGTDYGVQAFDIDTGERLWIESYPRSADYTPAITENGIYGVDTGGTFRRHDKQDGSVLEEVDIENAAQDIIPIDGKLAVTGDTGEFHLLEQVGLNTQIDYWAEGRNISSLVTAVDKNRNELVYTEDGDEQSKLRIWNLQNQEQVYNEKIGDGVNNKASLINGKYIFNQNGTTKAFDIANREFAWKKDYGRDETSPVETPNGNAIIGNDESVVQCVDIDDGSEIWSTDLGQEYSNIESSDTGIVRTAAGENVLMVGTDMADLYLLDIEDGTPVGEFLYTNNNETVTPGPIIGDEPVVSHYDGNGNRNIARLSGDPLSTGPAVQDVSLSYDGSNDLITFDVTAENVDYVEIDGIWGDWQVENQSVGNGLVLEDQSVDSSIGVDYDQVQDTADIVVDLFVDPDVYVGGTYGFDVTADQEGYDPETFNQTIDLG